MFLKMFEILFKEKSHAIENYKILHGGLGSIWIRTEPTPCTSFNDARQVPAWPYTYSNLVLTLMARPVWPTPIAQFSVS